MRLEERRAELLKSVSELAESNLKKAVEFDHMNAAIATVEKELEARKMELANLLSRKQRVLDRVSVDLLRAKLQTRLDEIETHSEDIRSEFFKYQMSEVYKNGDEASQKKIENKELKIFVDAYLEVRKQYRVRDAKRERLQEFLGK